MFKQNHHIGEHVLLDLFDIDPVITSDPQQVREQLLHAAKLAHATVLQAYFHHFGGNKGVTGVLLLSESHMSIHTWPENQFAAIDIFMCGQHQIQHATDYLKTAFKAKNFSLIIHNRGHALIKKAMNKLQASAS